MLANKNVILLVLQLCNQKSLIHTASESRGPTKNRNTDKRKTYIWEILCLRRITAGRLCPNGVCKNILIFRYISTK